MRVMTFFAQIAVFKMELIMYINGGQNRSQIIKKTNKTSIEKHELLS